ncbi:MAG TPA: DUF2849 domain-containing protein [Afifellaceae bacterium]|nr:DUF2849 domain-containing protein [Afifellaceae bacterium]
MSITKAIPLQIVTANSLGDGRVVFLARNGWSRRIAEALVLERKDETETALARAEADAAANQVVGPYAVDVRLERGLPLPLRLRERIRLGGPTTGNSRLNAGPREQAA